MIGATGVTGGFGDGRGDYRRTAGPSRPAQLKAAADED